MIHGVIRAGVLASTAPTIVLLAAVLVVFGIALLVVGVRLLRRTRGAVGTRLAQGLVGVGGAEYPGRASDPVAG